MIHHIHLACFRQGERETALAQLLAASNSGAATADRTASGKPFLRNSQDGVSGLSYSHVRCASGNISFVATAPQPTFAIDVEVYPSTAEDQNFTNSIATVEDASFIRFLRAQGLNAGTVLWMAKEAALKANGEVMSDPRNIAISRLPDGSYHASTAKSGTAPIAPAGIGFFLIETDLIKTRIMLAVAFASELYQHSEQTVEFDIHSSNCRVQGLFQG